MPPRATAVLVFACCTAGGRADPTAAAARIPALLDELRFRTPADGGPVRSSDVYELVQLRSIYSEDYIYGGAQPVSTARWNVGPLHYLFRREGGPSGGSACSANSTVTAGGNIPGGDLRKVAASSWRACAAACESVAGCAGWTFDCCNNSRPGSAGCYLKAAVSGISAFHGDVAGCSARGVAAEASACCTSHVHSNASYSVPPTGMRR